MLEASKLVSALEQRELNYNELTKKQRKAIKSYCISTGTPAPLFNMIRTATEQPTTEDCNEVLQAAKNSLRIHICRMIWKEMQTRGIPPNQKTFELLITVHADLGRNFARKFYEEMPQYGIEPNINIMHALVNSYIICEDGSMALRYAKEMVERFPKARLSYSIALKACAHFSYQREAEAFFEAFIASGFQPNKLELTSMIRSCAKDAERILQLYQMGKQLNILTEVGVITMLQYLSRIPALPHALNLANCIAKDLPNVLNDLHLFEALTYTAARYGHVQYALYFLNEYLRRAAFPPIIPKTTATKGHTQQQQHNNDSADTQMNRAVACFNAVVLSCLQRLFLTGGIIPELPIDADQQQQQQQQQHSSKAALTEGEFTLFPLMISLEDSAPTMHKFLISTAVPMLSRYNVSPNARTWDLLFVVCSRLKEVERAVEWFKFFETHSTMSHSELKTAFDNVSTLMTLR